MSTFGTKQWVATAVTVLIIVFVFAVVLPSLGDYSEAWTAIKGMSPGWIVALVVLTVGVVAVYPLPFNIALPGVGYRASFVVRQTSFMIGNVIPAGGAIGVGVQYGMLGSYGFSPAPSADAIGITSVSNTLVTLALPVVSLVGLVFIGEATTTAIIIAIVGVVGIVIAIALIAVTFRTEKVARRVGDWGDVAANRLAGLFHKSFDVNLGDELVVLRTSLLGLSRRRLLAVTGADALQQISGFLVLFVAILAIQGTSNSVNIAEAFAAFAVARLAVFIPLPPGGLGTSDAIMTSLLTQFGMVNSNAMAAVLIWRAATYIPQVFIGTGTLVLWRRNRARGLAPTT